MSLFLARPVLIQESRKEQQEEKEEGGEEIGGSSMSTGQAIRGTQSQQVALWDNIVVIKALPYTTNII